MSEGSYSVTDNDSVHDSTVYSQADLERELKLTKMKILDLENKMKRMKSKRIESNDVSSVTESEGESIITSEKFLSASAHKPQSARSYVNSLPSGATCNMDKIRFKAPNARPFTEDSQRLQDTLQVAQFLQTHLSLPPRPIPSNVGMGRGGKLMHACKSCAV